jgi:hypothetical protein
MTADLSEAVPGWTAFTLELRDLPAQMLARLPLDWRDDPQVKQEVGRLALASLAMRAIAEVGDDGDHPAFMPFINLTLAAYQPNADTTYRAAVITPGGSYRLRGRAGSLRIASIGQYRQHPSMAKALGEVDVYSYHDINALTKDEDGCFDVRLCPDRPEGYKGDWWPLHPGTHALVLRQVASDWCGERDPMLSIERTDIAVRRPRPAAALLRERLDRVASSTANTALLLIDHVSGLRDEGYVNRFKIWDTLMKNGGLAGQFYYEAVYDLGEDDALIIETKVPEQYGYYSMILTNQIFETTDWANNHSSLNDSQIQIDSDGLLRIVVSQQDPGVPNWMDIAGYPIGVIQGRWADCSEQPLPTVARVKIADVRNALPADTPRVDPATRERHIRNRRAALQQRPLW